MVIVIILPGADLNKFSTFIESPTIVYLSDFHCILVFKLNQVFIVSNLSEFHIHDSNIFWTEFLITKLDMTMIAPLFDTW